MPDIDGNDHDGRKEGTEDDGNETGIIYYDKTKSFFDMISSDAKDRAAG